MKKMYVLSGLLLGMMMASACGNESGSTASTEETTASSSSPTPETTTPETTEVKSAGESLIAANDCRGCHALDSKVIGPSYQDIAKKYENNTKNIETLAHKIMEGGQGNWGEIPMTAHPDLKLEDAKEIVKYILSQKP